MAEAILFGGYFYLSEGMGYLSRHHEGGGCPPAMGLSSPQGTHSVQTSNLEASLHLLLALRMTTSVALRMTTTWEIFAMWRACSEHASVSPCFSPLQRSPRRCILSNEHYVRDDCVLCNVPGGKFCACASLFRA